MQTGAEVGQRQVCEIARLYMVGGLAQAVGDGNAQRLQGLAGIEPAWCMALRPMHEDAHAVLRQQQGGQQEPGKLAALAGIRRPVDIDFRRRGGQGEQALGGAHESGDLMPFFFLDAQQHKEGAKLFG